MMQLKRIVAMRPMLVIGCMLALLVGRVSASENTWQLKNSTFNGMAVRMTLGQIGDVRIVEVPQHGQFLSLSIDGYVPMGAIGQPALPAYIKIIEIPQGAEPVVKILRDKVKIVDLSAYGRLPLLPMQAPVSKGVESAPAFAYNRQVYAVKGYQAPELVRVEIMGESRGVRLAKLIVSPVEYDPVKNRLRIHTDLDFEIRFEGADYNATQAKKRRYHSDGFRVAEEAGVNAAALRMEAVDAKAFKAAKAGRVTARPLRYAVVADPKFRDSLQGFIAWKRQQGYDVVEAYTSDEQVGTTADAIRAYLKKLYDGATEVEPAPTYVLLVGDITEIPAFPSRSPNLPEYSIHSNHVTDLYFVEYTDDTLPDAYLGRFSATTVEELMPQIHKTMYMSRIAGEAADFIDTTLLVAGFDANYNLSHLNPALRYIQAYATAEEGVASFLYPAPASSSYYVEDEIIARLSAGAGLVFYTGHGLEYEWSEPKISVNVLKSKIFNKDKYPMMVGNCCLTGKFNWTSACFGEQLLRSADKGAVVYIGATNNSFFDEDFYWIVGLTDISETGKKQYTYENTGIGSMDCFYHTHGEAYEDWAVTAADIIYRGNMAVESSGTILSLYYWEIYELFGDPSYRPYKKKPLPTPIECAAEIMVGPSLLSVQTAPYAQLSLNDTAGMPLAVVSADAEGRTDLPTEALQEGAYRIYGGASGYSDNEITVKAQKPTGKFVFVESVQLYDGDEAVSKGEYGKRYGVSLKIKNIGAEKVNAIRVRLRSDDPYFTAGEDYVYASVSEPGEVVNLDKKIFFSLSPDVPDSHLVHYSVELTPDEAAEPMSRTFPVLATAPELQLLGWTIDDAEAATPNGRLDGGETAKVVLHLCNAGTAAARDIQTTFESGKDYLILPEGEANWGTMAAGDTVTREFPLGADADKARHDVYTVVCKMNADGRVQEVEISSNIEVGVETFEAGGFGFAVVGVSASELRLHFKTVKERQGKLYILDVLGEEALTLAADLHLAAGGIDYAFPVAALKPGLYVCVFESADGRSAVKFIKR